MMQPESNLNYWRIYECPQLQWMKSHINYINALITEEINVINVSNSNWYKLQQEQKIKSTNKYQLNQVIENYKKISAERLLSLHILASSVEFIPSDTMIYLVTSKISNYNQYLEDKYKYAMGALSPFRDKLKSFGFETLILTRDHEYHLLSNCYKWMFFAVRCRITPLDIEASCKSRDLQRHFLNFEKLEYLEEVN